MRKYSRANATMKAITYGFFIYICLTTTHGKSATNSSNTSNKCNVTEVIKATNYLKECSLTFDGTKIKYELQIDTAIPYLCTGIVETVHRICELHKNLTISQKIFETEMKNLKPVTQHPNTFCDAMQVVLTNSTYVKVIDSSAHPNILELNKALSSPECRMLCWDSHVNSSRPICNVLLWANRVLVNPVVQIDPGVKQQKPAAPGSNAPQIQVESTKNEKSPEKSASVNKTVSLSPNRTETKQAEDNLKNKTSPPKSLLNDVTAGNRTAPIQPSNVLPKAPLANVEGSSVKKLASGVPLESKPNSDNIGGNEEKNKPEKSQMNQAPGDKNGISVGDDDAIDQRIDKPYTNENNEEIEEDGEDTGLVDGNEDNPLTKHDSNPVDETLETSHLSGKEDSPGGQVKATNQDNIVPHENVSAYPGPPDPPQHFFAYFMAMSFICLVCYIGYHKKHKIMAIIFEGRKSRGGRGRRRPNTAGYRKLDCNLEEAVTSQCNSNVTHVIY